MLAADVCVRNSRSAELGLSRAILRTRSQEGRWWRSLTRCCEWAMVAIAISAGLFVPEARAKSDLRESDTRTDRIEALQATLLERDTLFHAITALVPSALSRAAELDRRFGSDSAGPLDRLTIAVKANIDLEEVPANAGAKFERKTVPMDAPVVMRIRDAGGIVVAVTNMDTWARGTATVSQLNGSTGNAWNARRSPYGSSGGASVAVARGFVDAAIGTDTCGSLRLPATANGVFGLRPTAGAVSRSGVIPLSPTQDVVGPIARNVEVLGRVFSAIRGAETGDPLTLQPAAPPRRRRTGRIGVLRSMGGVSTSSEAPLAVLERSGITAISVASKGLVQANVIEDEFRAATEAWLSGQSFLDGHLDVPDPVGYRARLADRERLRSALISIMDIYHLDALVYPTTTAPPGLRGEQQTTANCWIAADSGLPALAVPGKIVNSFPAVGVDLLGRPFDESTLFELAGRLPAARTPPGV